MSSTRETASRKQKSGINLSITNILIMIIGIILAVGMIYTTHSTNVTYHSMMRDTDFYVLSQQTAGQMKDLIGSSLEAARSFLNSGNPGQTHAVSGQLQSVNSALDQFQLVDKPIRDVYLEDSIHAFRELSDIIRYALRLHADTLDVPLNAYPEWIQSARISEADAAKSPEGKQETARASLFSSSVTTLLSRINVGVDDSHRFVSDALDQRNGANAEKMSRLLLSQKIMIYLFLFCAAFALLLNMFLIIRPIQKSISRLDSRKELLVRGSYEMRHLARVYNDVLQDNEAKNEALSYSASHDALTGLYNRAAYDKHYRQHAGGQTGVVILDVDHFKIFNDEYGHDVGDKVLKRVATSMRKHFRASDHISRIGGDEFCVIMQNVSNADLDTLKSKISMMNQDLGTMEADVPPVSVCAGIALWDRNDPGPDLFKDADTALLRCKKERVRNCEIHGVTA